MKGEFGYDHWADLTARRGQRSADTAAAGGAGGDAMGGIMDLMKVIATLIYIPLHECPDGCMTLMTSCFV